MELLAAQVTVTVPSEVLTYLRAFDQMARIAVYGSEASARITSAINALA